MKKRLQFFKSLFIKPWNWFNRQSIKKKILSIAILLVSLFVISQVVINLTKPSPFSIEKVEKGNIVETVTEAGNIVTSGRSDVYSPSTGIVTENFVKNGEYVKEGDKLFTVKSSASDQEADAAHSNYLSALATLNAAQSNANTLRAAMYAQWKSFTDLATNSTYEKGDDTPNIDNRKAAEFQIAQDTWLASEKKYKDQETAIAQANAAVASTKALYDATQDATVTAPVDGIITNLSITKGSTISIKTISLTGGSSSPALIIMADHDNEILLELSETDVAKVKPGQKVKIKVNAISDKEYKGVVNRVDTIGTDNQGVVTFNAYITLLEGDDNIRLGMTVDAEITTKEISNVLSVPNSAVKPYKGGKAVRVPDPKSKEKFKFVPVIIGIRGEEKTEIIKGLKEGQEVITAISNENVKRPGLFGS